MAPKGSAKPKDRTRRSERVFLNVPYDPAYEGIFLALIAAVTATGKLPYCTLQVASFEDRRDRMFKLIESCAFSIHDITMKDRLNMPFELGYALAVERHRIKGRHRVLVVSDDAHEAVKRLSDLNGKDVQPHKMSPSTATSLALSQLKSWPGPQPTTAVLAVAKRLVRAAPKLVAQHAASSIYDTAVFNALRYAAIAECERRGLLG